MTRRFSYLLVLQIFGLFFLANTYLGCHHQYYGKAGFVRPENAPDGFSKDETWQIFFKTTYFYPVRDVFDLELQWSRLTGRPSEAADVTANGEVPDSSFYINRDITCLSPERLAQGPNTTDKPMQPFTILKVKTSGGSRGFFAQDGRGDKYLVKLDDPDYPDCGSGAEIIAARIYWALGYRVPESYLVTITGTGDAQFDGQRALASKFVPGETRGGWKYNWVRDRREFRALKLVAMWLNDLDRSDNNNIAAVHDDLITFYMLDFNSALGSWQGRAKEPWQGCQYRWDVEKQFLTVITLGLYRWDCQLEDIYESPAIGRLAAEFDPDQWRAEKSNPAFDRMTPADAKWMADKIEQFTSEQLTAVIKTAQLSNPRDEQRLLEILLARREIILHWCRQLSATAP
ncbi:MAG: hypothetical protein JW709_08475 [Sedimentisphaerales bacterium]|nr:hypothetical protein [Sedimentisphaerales bacterium]